MKTLLTFLLISALYWGCSSIDFTRREQYRLYPVGVLIAIKCPDDEFLRFVDEYGFFRIKFFKTSEEARAAIRSQVLTELNEEIFGFGGCKTCVIH